MVDVANWINSHGMFFFGLIIGYVVYAILKEML